MGYFERVKHKLNQPYCERVLTNKTWRFSLFLLFFLFMLLHFLIFYVVVDFSVFLESGGILGSPEWYRSIIDWHASFNPHLIEQVKASGNLMPYHGGIYSIWVFLFLPVFFIGFVGGDFSRLIGVIKAEMVKGEFLKNIIKFLFYFFSFHLMVLFLYYLFFEMGGVYINREGIEDRFFLFESKGVLIVLGAPAIYLITLFSGMFFNFYARFFFVLVSEVQNKK
ncbi:hypothetical protein PCIT_b0959 [Pseudoalteromonas citrea]|uniref:Uncharacterized protein n=2 Tax=Pseudoalteromonas citrea TaxID=43655 RepID=A0AAD4FQA6_9GAMM|nr:hypothetical protein [Pseudoalteromonas citrea]KAF7764867.1 hypothetical protein PCIT_b0959 [Pseudoalteromonas citrea]